MSFERKKILILVKTYPHPSNKSIETVCTAGLTDDGDWIRIYPVPYRYLAGEQQFKIFDWIEADVKKRNPGQDPRKESYHVEASSIRIVGHLDSEDDAARRFRLLQAAAVPSFEEVQRRHKGEEKASLAAIRPHIMYGLEFKKVAEEWSPKELTALNQLSMVAQNDGQRPLRKVPYEIRCSFDDSNEAHTHHNILLTAWEYNWLLLKLIDQYYGDEEKAKNELNKRWMQNFAKDRTAYLILGTPLQQDRFSTFIAIGYCIISNHYIKQGEQLNFFDDI